MNAPINSDTVDTNVNPFGNPQVKATMAQKRSEDMVESLRRNCRKVLDDYSIPLDAALPFMATLSPSLEVAALDRFQGNMYLDKLTAWCIQEVNKSAPKTVGSGKPRVVGYGKDRHVDTGVIEMPQRTGVKQSQFDDAPKEPSPPKTVLGNPIPAELPEIEIPDDVKTALENIKSAATNHFDDDELTAKTVEGEVIKEEPAPRPQTINDPAKEVATMLNLAFPDASETWKLHFFRETSGFQKVAEAVLAVGWTSLKASLEAGIADAKANPVETVATPKASVEIPTEKLPENGQNQNATNTDSDKTLSPQIVPQSGNVSGLPSAVQKADNALMAVEPARSRLIPSRDECEFVFGYSRAVAASRFYKGIDTPEKAQVVMFKGLSIGIQALDALDGFDVIDDPKRGISLFPRVKLLRGLVERTGKCRRFDIAGDDKKCTVTIQREGRGINTYTFTIDDARAMNLTNKYNWQAMPGRMLMWRACSLAIAADFPEVVYSFGQASTVDEDDIAA